jgi:hypothetical protein
MAGQARTKAKRTPECNQRRGWSRTSARTGEQGEMWARTYGEWGGPPYVQHQQGQQQRWQLQHDCGEWVSPGTQLSWGITPGRTEQKQRMDWLTTDRWLLMDTKGLRNLYQDPRHQRSEHSSLLQVPPPHIANVLVRDPKPPRSPPKPPISRSPTPAIWSASGYNVATGTTGWGYIFLNF